MTIINNTFTACGGLYGTYTVNCSGMMPGHLPTFPNGGGFCNGVNGKGVMIPSTCDMATMKLSGNRPAVACGVNVTLGVKITVLHNPSFTQLSDVARMK